MENYEEFKKCRDAATRNLCSRLSPELQSVVAYAPLVVASLAFHYGDRCRKYVAEHRLSYMRELSRGYDKVKEQWRNLLRTCLDDRHIQFVTDEAEDLLKKHELDFARLWFSANNQFKLRCPDWPHADMRTDALCGQVTIRAYMLMYDRIKLLFIANMMPPSTVSQNGNPIITSRLSFVLKGFSGDLDRFDYKDVHIETATKILLNTLDQLKMPFLIDEKDVENLLKKG